MLICLDFDGTYTSDPKFWDSFIKSARLVGHKVIVCTMRYEYEGNLVVMMLGDKVHGIYFSGRVSKQKYLASLGIAPNIWIDDQPHFILMDATNTNELIKTV